MGSTEQWAARRETASESAPPAERVVAWHSAGICGELLPHVALVGAVCDLAWSRTSPRVLSSHVGVEGNLVDFPSSPSQTPVRRQSEHGPYGCLRIKSAPTVNQVPPNAEFGAGAQHIVQLEGGRPAALQPGYTQAVVTGVPIQQGFIRTCSSRPGTPVRCNSTNLPEAPIRQDSLRWYYSPAQ